MSSFFVIDVRSQDKDKPKAPLVLERANLLRNKVIGNENVKELIDNVRISRGDMIIDCDYAVHYQNAERIIFEKNVHYSDSLRDMWAEKVTYYIAEDSLKAEIAVKIVQDNYESYCHTAYYSDERENVHLHRDVELHHQQENIVLSGFKGFGDKTMEYARVTGQAHLVQKDSAGFDDFTIDAETIEFFNLESFALATDSVKMMREDVTGYCDTLYNYMEKDYALMLVDPVVFRDRDEMRGDSIYLYLVENKIEHIEIIGHASALSQPEQGSGGDFNKMFGRKIFVYMQENKIHRILVQGNASSLYYLYEDEKPKGVNKTTGDKIYLNFAEGQLETINVSGGSEGTYYPPDYPGIIE